MAFSSRSRRGVGGKGDRFRFLGCAPLRSEIPPQNCAIESPPLPCGRHATAMKTLSSIPVLSRPYDCTPVRDGIHLDFAMALDPARTSVLPSLHSAPTQPNRHEEHPVGASRLLCHLCAISDYFGHKVAQSGTPNRPKCHPSQLRNAQDSAVWRTFSGFLAPGRPSRMTVEWYAIAQAACPLSHAGERVRACPVLDTGVRGRSRAYPSASLWARFTSVLTGTPVAPLGT